MISDDDLKGLKEERALFDAGGWCLAGCGVDDWKPCPACGDRHEFDLMPVQAVAVFDRLTFAERCLADLHDETAAAEAVLRLTRENARLRAALLEIAEIRNKMMAYDVARKALGLGPLDGPAGGGSDPGDDPDYAGA